MLPHLLDPSATISALQKLLKPGGVLASQEPIVSECWTTPKSLALKDYLALMLAFAVKVGLDFDFAKKIPDLFRQKRAHNKN